MDINIHLWKRRSGKTRCLVHDFLKNPDDSYIIVMDYNMRDHIIGEYNSMRQYKKHIISSNSLDKFISKRVNTLFIDEYCYIDNIEEIRHVVDPAIPLDDGNVNIFSSVDEFSELDAFICAMVRNQKKIGNSLSKLVSNFDEKEYKHLITKWWNSYITQPDANFISHPDKTKNENLHGFVRY